MKPTIKQLFKFIAKRWRALPSNAQFATDAESCGFKVSDLGKPKLFKDKHGTTIYVWTPECLNRTHVQLMESGNFLFLIPEHFPLPEGFEPCEPKED